MSRAPFLVTSALEEFWSQDSGQIVFLTEGAKLHRSRSRWKDLDFSDAPYVWDSGARKSEAFGKCQSIYETFLPELTDQLNCYHGLSHNKEYYRIVLGDWLFRFIQIAYDRYSSIEVAFATYPELTTYLLDCEQEYISDDTEDFINKAEGDDRYNLQLYSQILRAQGKIFPTKKISKPLRSNRSISHSSSWINRIIKQIISKLMLKLSVQPRVLLTNPYFGENTAIKILNLFIRSGRRVVWNDMEENITLPKSIDYDYRRNVAPVKLKNDGHAFERILSKILFLNLPIMYLEGYHELVKSVNKYKNYNFSHVYTGNALHVNSIFKMYLAEARDSICVYSHQHGGSYGIDKVVMGEVYERSIVDYFYSWGWGESGVKYLPPPRNTCKWSPDKRNPYILLAMTSMPRYIHVLKPCASSNDFLYKYIMPTCRFINVLNQSLELKIRFHGNEYGWDIKSRLTELGCTNWKDDYRSNTFLNDLKYCEIFVTDHLMTTALEGLASGVPTVIFFTPDLYDFRDDAKKLIQKLRAVGIIHDTPESAANHISHISDNVNAWWLHKDVVAARDEFVEKYARFDKDWVGYWIKHAEFFQD